MNATITLTERESKILQAALGSLITNQAALEEEYKEYLRATNGKRHDSISKTVACAKEWQSLAQSVLDKVADAEGR